MVNVLIRMKLTALRHTMNQQRASEMISGVSIGLLAAAGTVWFATPAFGRTNLSADALAAVFFLWLIGWIMGPIFFGGGDQALRPEYFTLLPIPPRRLATSLFITAFVGVGALVTFFAFSSLVVYGARFGAGLVMISVPAVLLQLALVILLSRLATEVLNEAMKSQAGAILSAFISAAIIALLGSGWALVPAISQALTRGVPSTFSVILRALPSGWGLVAVDAASRSHWVLAMVVITGQAVLVGAVLVSWSALLVRHTTTRQAARPSKLRMMVVFQHTLLATTAVGATISKELRNWLRDPMRMQYLYFALFYALLFCLVPLAVDIRIFLPWSAAIFIVMASMNTNFYGTDGSALWLILLTPGAERCDVRGRQGAWALLVAPIAIFLTVGLTAVSGQRWAWPWVLATTPALLGGAAGLVLLISVFYAVPRTDPRWRGNNALQAGGDIGQAILLLLLVPITAVPALAVVGAGVWQNNAFLQWAGIGVGIATGVLSAWWLGRIAYRRLVTRGPELLLLMRSGSSARFGSRGARGLLSGLSTGRRQVVIFCLSFCWIPLIPQGIVPMIMKLSGNIVPSWFLALYLPKSYQWPTIFAMIALGAFLLGTGIFNVQRANEQQARRSALHN